MPKSPKPSISIIGAGRLGRALGIALTDAGYPITAMVARHVGKAREAVRLLSDGKSKRSAVDEYRRRKATAQGRGKMLPSVMALAVADLNSLPESRVILISTPDDEIPELAQKLAAANRGQQTRRGAVLHTSGALSSKVLAPLKEIGFKTGSLHPLVSVSEPRAGSQALRRAFYCIEGQREAVRVARTIVRDLEGTAFSIRPESKALYHAAAVMASPHLTALFDLAVTMLSECGLDRKVARQVLIPLLESTVNNLKALETDAALTGTFARGDVTTVKRHLEALNKKEQSVAREVYGLLGLHSLKLAKKNRLDPKLTKQIESLLSKDISS